MPDDNQTLGSLFDNAHAEVAGQQPEVPQDQPSRATLEYLAKQGFDVSEFKSDDDWLSTAEAFQAERMSHQAELSDWQRSRDQFLEWQKSQQQPVEPEKAPEVEQPKKVGWQSPQVSETALVLLENGGFEPHPTMQGFVKAKDPYMQRFADEINQRTLFKRKKADLIFDNPEQFYEETGLIQKLEEKFKQQPIDVEEIVKRAKEEAKKEWMAEITQAQQQRQAETNFLQVAPLLYQTDANGQFLRNAAGNGVPTELGKAYEQTISTLMSRGIDVEQAKASALDLLGPQLKAPEVTPKERREEKKDTWLDKAKTRNGNDRLSPDDARISEAARAAERNPNGHKKISDIWDEAHKAALSEMR